MKELNKCARCGRVLVGQEEVHAIRGSLYCSKNCAVQDIMDDYLMNAKEMAIEEYDNEAEVVRTEDVLAEDLQTVEIVVTCKKRIKLPADLTKAEALAQAAQLYAEGLVAAEPGDCDDYTIEYTLVSEDNSVNEEE